MAAVIYSDLHPELMLTELRDIFIVKNEQSIEASIQNILLTYPGERIMRPEFGSRIEEYLFENLTSEDDLVFIEMEVRQAIETAEKRIKIVTVQAESVPDSFEIVVKVAYVVIASGVQIDSSFVLFKKGGI